VSKIFITSCAIIIQRAHYAIAPRHASNPNILGLVSLSLDLRLENEFGLELGACLVTLLFPFSSNYTKNFFENEVSHFFSIYSAH
jgi:hypothetical protein